MIDFSLPAELAELQTRVRDFIAHEVIPMKGDPRQGSHGPEPALREALVARIFADLRGFRIYDGTSEVHRWSLAKHILKGTATEARA